MDDHTKQQLSIAIERLTDESLRAYVSKRSGIVSVRLSFTRGKVTAVGEHSDTTATAEGMSG